VFDNDLHISFQMCTKSPEFPTFMDSFLNRYQTEFGFVLQNRDVLVDDVRVRGIGKTEFHNEAESETTSDEPPVPAETSDVFFEDRYIPTSVFKIEDLLPGNLSFISFNLLKSFYNLKYFN
jgi:5-oxoprolinase (ATP-hydrolysing)